MAPDDIPEMLVTSCSLNRARIECQILQLTFCTHAHLITSLHFTILVVIKFRSNKVGATLDYYIEPISFNFTAGNFITRDPSKDITKTHLIRSTFNEYLLAADI